MTYLQLFGLGFVIVHTIAILFINKISLGKRLFLAAWMAVFVLGVPMIYSYLSSLAFMAVCGVAIGVYVILLFSQESKTLKNRLFRKRRRHSVTMEDLWDIEDGPSPVGPGTASIVNAAADTAAPAAAAPASPQAADQAASAGQIKPETQESGQADEPSLVNDMLKKLDQIDTLLSSDGLSASEAAAETERLSQSLQQSAPSASAQPAAAQAQPEAAQPAPAQSAAAGSASLEDLLFGGERAAQPSAGFVMPEQPLSATVSQDDVAPLTEAQEEELLSEIDDIIASHTELEKEWSAQQLTDWSDSSAIHANPITASQPLVPSAGETAPAAAAQEGEVFTLRPIAEQTIDIIKEKQDEDGLLSVEEQLDKELYFQFLLYESKELLAMGMYQETVDYLKEILIDSYDKGLRREALELLESVKVDLYHPKFIGDMNQDYKKLEERKVL